MDKTLQLKIITSLQDRLAGPLKRMRGETAASAGSVKDLRDKLKGLESTQKTVGQFRDLSKGLTDTSNKLHAAQARVAELAGRMRNTAQPTAQLRREFQQATRQAQQLKQQHQQQSRELQGLRTNLHSAGISTKNLSAADRQLRSSMSQVNKELEKHTDRLGKAAQQQRRLNAARDSFAKGQALTAKMAGGGAAAMAAGGGALYMGARMMAPQLQAEGHGAMIAAQSGEAVALGAQYTRVIEGINSAGIGTDINQIAAAVAAVRSTLGAMGEVGETELDRITRKALDLSSAFGGDVAEHIQIASIMMKNGLAANSDEALDLMVSGMQRVSTQMRGELPEILHEYSTHFRNLGFSGSEAMSLLIDMAQQGKFALDKTGDAIKEFSIRGSDMSKASTEAYEQIGLNAAKMSAAIASGGDQARQAMQQTANGLLAIKDPADRANAAIALFGTPIEDLSIEQIPNFLAALAGASDKLGDVSGAANQLGQTMRDNLQGDIGQLKGAMDGLRFDMFDGESSGLRDLVQSLTEGVRGMRAWVKENPELTGMLLKSAVVIAALVAGFGALSVMLASILGPMVILRYGFAMLGIKGGLAVNVLKMVGQALLFIARAALMNPVGLLIMGIIAAAVLIYKYWEPISSFFSGLWDRITATFEQAKQAVMSRMIEAFQGGIGGIAALLLDWSPIGLFYQAFAAVMSYLGIDLPARFSEFGAMLISGLINGITGMAGRLKDSVVGAASGAMTWFKDKLGIHSPSRVFAGYGANISEGAALGIMGSSDRVTAAARMMTAGVLSAATALPAQAAGMLQQEPIRFDQRPAMRSAMPAGSQGANAAQAGIVIEGDKIEITIQAAPGANPADLVRLISQELDRRDAQKSARLRSSLADYGR
ncbi:phage tail tape measure protein [Alcaligenaceae bacterium SJ-26]|nr:phage tail tape measure protein [Alcaligenaceae bacterium SJ-26]